jgi:regulatory protein
MRSERQPAPPLNPAKLRALALYYVGRFATTRGKLRIYLKRKLKERGWDEETPPDLDQLIEDFAERNYVDDLGYAVGKTASLKRRGMGPVRIKSALQGAGIDASLIADLTDLDEEEAHTLAIDFARRKKIGPFAINPGDERLQRRWMGAFLRAGHNSNRARAILKMNWNDEPSA